MVELNEQQTIEARDALKTLLSSGTHKIECLKADGSERIMNCTRDPKLLKEELSEGLLEGTKKDGTPRKEAITSVRAVDVEKGEWRAFTIARVLKVNDMPFNEYLKLHVQLV